MSSGPSQAMFGHVRLLVDAAADAVAGELDADAEAAALDLGLDGAADRADVVAGRGLLEAELERRLRGGHQPLLAGLGPADGDRAAGVGVEAVELGGHVELDQLALAQAARGRGCRARTRRRARCTSRPGSRSRAAGPSGRRGGRRRCAATSSSSAVVTPGRTRRAISRIASATTWPAARMACELLGAVDGHPVILTYRCHRPLSLDPAAATCSSSRSIRSRTAATASRASRATWCSWPAGSPATACAPSSASPRRPTPRRA